MIVEKSDSRTSLTQSTKLPVKSDTYSEEQPPPYVSREDAPSDTNGPSFPAPHRSNSYLQSSMQQEVNHFVLDSTHMPISGSYIVNAELPVTHVTTRGCRKPLDKKNIKLLGHSQPPNASVHTRHGAISLNLATAGRSDMPTKAHAQISSRHGKVHVNLVSTRHGHIVVFVPPNFQGALQVRSRHNKINFLPGFGRSARLVNASDQGALVLFGQGLQSSVDLSDPSVDSCLISSRHGRITIGVSGVDHYDDVCLGSGLLAKLGSLSMMLLGTDVTSRVR